MAYESGEQVKMYAEGLSVAESAQADAAAAAGAPVSTHEQTVVPLGTAGNLPSTIDITDTSGEVVQRLMIPEELQLEPGQTLVLIQGEDGIPQLAVINQAGKCSTNATYLKLGTNLTAYSTVYSLRNMGCFCEIM